MEQHLLQDPECRRHVALLKRAVAEEPEQPAPAPARYVLYFSKGKLSLLRGPSAPTTAPSPDLLLTPDLGPAAIELRLRPDTRGLSLAVRTAVPARAALHRGTALVVDGEADPDGVIRFADVPPARYKLRVCLGADELPPVVLDIHAA